MSRIPSPLAKSNSKIVAPKIPPTSDKIVFSFESIDRNEYFNLDATCENWSNDLFNTMKTVSNIDIKDIYAGKYSTKGSTLRIHQHGNASAPCKIPQNLSLEDLWQIRISSSKGGVHGRFVENVFYVIWLDPHHNLYPNDNFGGLKKITPPKTCCKDREELIEQLMNELAESRAEAKFWEECAKEAEAKLVSK